MTPIIEVKGLSKKYMIGEHQSYLTLRDSLAELIMNPFRIIKEGLKKDEFWALKDINFSIEPGEVVGVIGRNGAGKSTLLKILSRITPPTKGEVTLRGRVGSLLEVGTGFQQELTGRENIFLNGAVLGMSQVEIKHKFDEIVAFAEVEKFIDTPVKHYSSGMYMRLAFSIAAHLDPEILIVDEVLAVGDAEFQKKCLGKMDEVSKKQGKTVLFVSHNFEAIRTLCKKSILLVNGKISKFDFTKKILDEYSSPTNRVLIDNHTFPLKTKTNNLTIKSFALLKNGKNLKDFVLDELDILEWKIEIELHVKPKQFNLVLGFENSQNERVVAVTSTPSIESKDLLIGKYSLSGKLEHVHLKSGRYSISLGVRFNNNTDIYVDKIYFFSIQKSENFEGQNGYINTRTKWEIKTI